MAYTRYVYSVYVTIGVWRILDVSHYYLLTAYPQVYLKGPKLSATTTAYYPLLTAHIQIYLKGPTISATSDTSWSHYLKPAQPGSDPLALALAS